MFNENPGTCVLMRKGGSTTGHIEAPFLFFLCFGRGSPLEELAESVCVFFFRGSAAHEKCRAELCRPRLPRRSDAEIFIGCLFSFSL